MLIYAAKLMLIYAAKLMLITAKSAIKTLMTDIVSSTAVESGCVIIFLEKQIYLSRTEKLHSSVRDYEKAL